MEYMVFDYTTGKCTYADINDNNKHYLREVSDAFGNKEKIIVLPTAVYCSTSLKHHWHTLAGEYSYKGQHTYVDDYILGVKEAYLAEHDMITFDMLKCKHGEGVEEYARRFRHDYPNYCSRYDGEYTFKQTAFNSFYKAHKPLIVGVVENKTEPTAVVLYRDIGNYYLDTLTLNTKGNDIHYFVNGVVSQKGVYAIVDEKLTTVLPKYMLTDNGLIPVDNRGFLVTIKPSLMNSCLFSVFCLMNGKIEYLHSVGIPNCKFDFYSTIGQFLPSGICALDCGSNIMGSTMVDLYGNIVKC